MKIRTLAIAVALATAPLAAACGEETAEQETSMAASEESTGTEDTEGVEEDLGLDETTGDEASDETIADEGTDTAEAEATE